MRRTAASTCRRFSIGSPMPMKTIVRSVRPAVARFAAQMDELLHDLARR